MLTIDGSHLEGGGQILRAAVALSALSATPVTIERIRAGRKNPGLAPQHIAAVQAVAAVTDATTEGLTPGSDRLVFSPGKPTHRESTVRIDTAGSIPLVLQAWLPVALSVGGSLTVTGGTEVAWSPTIDYVDHLLAGVLRCHGAAVGIEVAERGYFPRGGGLVTVSVKPSRLSPIMPAGDALSYGIASCSANLPDHVIRRQADAALRPPCRSRDAGSSCHLRCTKRWGEHRQFDHRLGRGEGRQCAREAWPPRRGCRENCRQEAAS